jgi:hypothetical protein
MANKKVILVTLLALCFTSAFSQINQGLISVGAHKNGVSIGEQLVLNNEQFNIGFLQRYKNVEFSADFTLSKDTLCLEDWSQIVLLDSSLIGRKKFSIKAISGLSNQSIQLDSLFRLIVTDTGWYEFELTVKLGRRKKLEQAGFYVLPRPYYNGPDTLKICHKSNTFYFVPGIEQCIGCNISFPNAASGLDSIQLTITKDTLFTFSFQNSEGCSDQKSVWFEYHPTPTITALNSSSTICNEDTINIGYQTNGTINWISHAYQGSTVDVSPSLTTTYYANASSLAGCVSEVDSITVTVDQLPLISLQDSNYVCVGLTEELTPQISGNGGYQFSWSSGETTKDITITDATAPYTLTVTDINGCVETHTVYNNLIDYTIDAGLNDSICYGETYHFLPFQGDYATVEWSIQDSAISSVLNHSVTPLLTTWYTLTTTNDSGCVKIDSVNIFVDSLSQLNYSIHGLEDLKIGDTISFKNLNVEPLHSYSWLIDGSVISTQNDSTFWVPAFDGQYSVSLEGRNRLLCQVTLDSTFTVREIQPKDFERILYPNPTTGKFSYNFYSDIIQEVTVTIFDEGSKTLTSEQRMVNKGMNTFTFDITDAAAGRYYIVIKSELGTQNAIRPWVIKV